MNIFILDKDLVKSAHYLVDQHITKMQLEHAQLLSTAYWADRVLQNYGKLTPQEQQVLKTAAWQIRANEKLSIYQPAFMNHPCNLWTRQSLENWLWLKEYTLVMQEEWRKRYDHPKTKTHKSTDVILTIPTPNLPSKGLTKFALAMPDQYKSDDPIESYRAYYRGEKDKLAKWKHGEKPSWY